MCGPKQPLSAPYSAPARILMRAPRRIDSPAKVFAKPLRGAAHWVPITATRSLGQQNFARWSGRIFHENGVVTAWLVAVPRCASYLAQEYGVETGHGLLAIAACMLLPSAGAAFATREPGAAAGVTCGSPGAKRRAGQRMRQVRRFHRPFHSASARNARSGSEIFGLNQVLIFLVVPAIGPRFSFRIRRERPS